MSEGKRQNVALERQVQPFSRLEPGAALEARSPRQLERASEVPPHLGRAMCVGAEDDWQSRIRTPPKEILRGVLLADRFVETCRVQFDGDVAPGRLLAGGRDEFRPIPFGPIAEFLDQVHVAHDVEEPAADRGDDQPEVPLIQLPDVPIGVSRHLRKWTEPIK